MINKLLVVLFLWWVNHAESAVITFEDLNPSTSSFDSMPSPYKGFTFTNWFYGPDLLYRPASGVIDLFTDYADPNNPDARVITDNNAITATSPFIFDGATFSGYSGVTFQLYLGGNLVHTSMTLADAVGPDAYLPTVLSSGYGLAVDTVKVSGVQGYYSMDDFSYHAVTVAAIPEPGTYALMFAGLLAVGIAGRRRAA
jgi:PEP-CTERM motif